MAESHESLMKNELYRELWNSLDGGADVNPNYTPDEIRAMWYRWSEPMTRQFARENPGERPMLWWENNSPETRPQCEWTDPEDHYAADRKLWRARQLAVLIRNDLLFESEKDEISREAREDALLFV